MSDLEYSDSEQQDEENDSPIDKELIVSKSNTAKRILSKVSNSQTINDDEDDLENDEEEEDEEEDDDDISDDEDYEDIINNNPEDLVDKYEEASTKEIFEIDDTNISPINSDIESEDEENLQKFDIEKRKDYINNYHPECFTSNAAEIELLCKVERNSDNIIIDDNHKTTPILTKYEKTRILGQRAKQINSGHQPLVEVPPNMFDGYLIANLELKEKEIPIIIRRPLPGGKSEYWKLKDLEVL